MKTQSFMVTAACALGLGLASLGGAGAAPLSSGSLTYSPGQDSLIQQIQWGRRCGWVTRCRWNSWGRRVCSRVWVCR